LDWQGRARGAPELFLDSRTDQLFFSLVGGMKRSLGDDRTGTWLTEVMGECVREKFEELGAGGRDASTVDVEMESEREFKSALVTSSKKPEQKCQLGCMPLAETLMFSSFSSSVFVFVIQRRRTNGTSTSSTDSPQPLSRPSSSTPILLHQLVDSSVKGR